MNNFLYSFRQSAEEKVREEGREEVSGSENEEREASTKKERQWYGRRTGEVKRMETLMTEVFLRSNLQVPSD